MCVRARCFSTYKQNSEFNDLDAFNLDANPFTRVIKKRKLRLNLTIMLLEYKFAVNRCSINLFRLRGLISFLRCFLSCINRKRQTLWTTPSNKIFYDHYMRKILNKKQ